MVLLENVGSTLEKEDNDAAFASKLASLAVYVNDAFSVAHRAHASTEKLPRLLPSAAGRLMQAELAALNSALGSPERPVGAIVGGAKIDQARSARKSCQKGRHACDWRRDGEYFPLCVGY